MGAQAPGDGSNAITRAPGTCAWTNVRGRQATDPTIERYSSPGISAVVSASYGW
jgi:hypothetical protein